MPVNPGFEEVTHGIPTGWSLFTPNQGYEQVTEQVYEGNYSVKITNLNLSAGLRSSRIPVTPEVVYEASVMSYNVDTNSDLYLEFWDASNRRITPVSTKMNGTREQWEPSVIRQAAPANAVTASLLIYLSSANLGTTYYDAASFRIAPEAPEEGGFDHVILSTSKTLHQLGDVGQLDWYGLRSDGTLLPDDAVTHVVYESLNPDVIQTNAVSGQFEALAIGDADIKVTVTSGQVTKHDLVTFRVDDFSGPLTSSKTKSTYYTDEKRAHAAANIAAYDWARAQRDAAVANAAPYAALSDDQLWSLVTTQSVSRSLGIAQRYKLRVKPSPDPDDVGLSNYGNYPWKIDVINQPWKLQSPVTGKYFPTNDFASFYESGIDEYGAFNYKLALENGQDFLKPEDDPSSTWAVDDGWGWIDENGDVWTFIAYYNHWGIWYQGFIQKALDSLRDAYLFTGDEEYAYKGLVLLDRVADVYPDLDVTAFPWHLGFDNGDPGIHTSQGKAVNDIWETGIAKSLLFAYDAFFPAMETLEARLAAFLSDKSDTYHMANPKASKEAIRKNIEDNIVRIIYPGMQQSQIRGNMGMHQSALALAAVVLDEEGTSKEWLDFVFQTGDLVRIPDSNAEYGRRYEVTGGDMSRLLVNEVDRDGMGNEAAPGYNALWLNTFMQAAEILDGYERYPEYDLFQNVKFQQMFSAFYPLTTLGRYTPSIGDSGFLGSPGVVGNIQHDIMAFERWGNPLHAQLIYLKNGNNTGGIHGSIFSANPEQISGDIEAVIEEHGMLQLDSTLMSGYGLAVLRDGSPSMNANQHVYDFQQLPILSANRGTRYLPNYEALLFQNTSGEGASITFEFDVPSTGTFEVRLLPNKAPSYGRYRYAIDGQWLGTYDFYGGSAPQEFSTLATLALEEGAHTLTFEYEGQSDGSTGYYAAFKKLDLIPEGEEEAPEQEDTQRDIWMYFGRNGGHGHKDSLNLGLHAFGMDLAPDLGYPDVTGSDPKRMEWTENTIAHNTVVVDKSKQGASVVGIPHHFDDSADVKLIDVEVPHAYSQTDMYRRTTSMIRVDEEHSYAVDFFRIEGGSHHAFSFHSADSTVTTEGLELVPQTDQEGRYVGTLAGPDVPYGQKEPGSGTGSGYRGSGFHYLYDVDRASPGGPFSVEWKVKDTWNIHPEDPDARLRLTMLNEVDEVALASGEPPQNNARSPEDLRFMVASRSGTNLQSTFVSVLEPYRYERFISGIEGLAVKRDGQVVTDGSAQAVKVTLADGREDYIVYALDREAEYTIDDRFTFSGFFGVYREQDGEGQLAYVQDGTYLGEVGEPAVIDESLGHMEGTVQDFTRELSVQNELIVYADLQQVNPEELVGRAIHIETDRIRNGVYEIKGIEPLGNQQYRLDIGSSTLIRGYQDAHDFDQGFAYDIAPQASFRIPLSYSVLPDDSNGGEAEEIRVSGIQAEAPAGTAGQLTVERIDLHGIREDATAWAEYVSTDPTVADVLPGGIILYKHAGATVIQATYGAAVSEPLEVRVTGTAVSDSQPGKPGLSDNNGHDHGLKDGNYTVTMNLWYGSNGTVYRLYENDRHIYTRLLADSSPAAQQVGVEVAGKTNGEYVYRAELINHHGSTWSDPLTVAVTDAHPGKPVLSHDNRDRDESYIITMNLWWGTNALEYRLYENGLLIDSQPLTANTPNPQRSVTALSGQNTGVYEYQAELINEAGSSWSDKIFVEVNE